MWVGCEHVWQGTISLVVAVRQTEHLVLGGKFVLGGAVCCFGSGFLLLAFVPLFLFGVFLFFFL